MSEKKKKLEPALDFSPRQLVTMLWWNNPDFQHCLGVIADGAVRSGKTTAIAYGFLLWSMSTFDGYNFGLCGKTIRSFERNVLIPMKGICASLGYSYRERKSENMIEIVDRRTRRSNRYYMFGGNDERSQDLIQGITLAGLLLDEVVLMPESFVNQALARLSVTGAKVWMSCNPEGLMHYVKLRFVDRYNEAKLLYVHFTMDDNYSLSEERRDFYKSQFTGVFYRRYVLGEWCLASGLVMSAFDRERHVIEPPKESDYKLLFFSGDYGTTNPTALLIIGYNEKLKCFDVLDEYYYNSRETEIQKSDAEYVRDTKDFVKNRPILRAFLDPAAASFIVALREAHIFPRLESANNDVDAGIKWTNMMFSTNRLRISNKCVNLIKELQVYSYDEDASIKEGRDVVKKEMDHAVDALRYFCYSEVYGRRNMYNMRDIAMGSTSVYER